MLFYLKDEFVSAGDIQVGGKVQIRGKEGIMRSEILRAHSSKYVVLCFHVINLAFIAFKSIQFQHERTFCRFTTCIPVCFTLVCYYLCVELNMLASKNFDFFFFFFFLSDPPRDTSQSVFRSSLIVLNHYGYKLIKSRPFAV